MNPNRLHGVVFSTALLAAALGAARPVSARDEAPFRAGVASVKITPDRPLRLMGYASRTEVFSGVDQDLYAKALAFDDGAGNRAVLLTSDLIGFRGAFAERLCSGIMARFELERRQILLNASHTHAGPAVDTDAHRLDMAREHAEATAAYSRDLEAKLVALVGAALDDLAPARLGLGQAIAWFVMNRREPTADGVRIGVNPSGLADRSVPILRVDSPDGALRAVVFGVACHNTTLTGSNLEVSGDYAGYAQAYIEGHLPGVKALFVQGCGGDANPHPRGTLEIARRHGTELGKEVVAALEQRAEPVAGPLRTLLRTVALPLRPAPSPEELAELERDGGWRGFVGGRMREVIERDGRLPETYAAPIALWQFGDDLTLVGLPGEVVVDYRERVAEALGPLRLWVAGYANDVFGYLPSARVVAEGGYEDRGLYAGGVGFFAAAVEETVVGAVKALAREAGRELPR